MRLNHRERNRQLQTTESEMSGTAASEPRKKQTTESVKMANKKAEVELSLCAGAEAKYSSQNEPCHVEKHMKAWVFPLKW